jgi:hypothetical protein
MRIAHQLAPSCPAQAGHPVTTGIGRWLLDHPLSRVMTSVGGENLEGNV